MKRENKMSEIKFPAFQAALLELQGDMTIEEFAKKIGLSRATTGFYISGSRLPDALRLRQIAEACNVSVDWLLGLSNAKERTCDITQIANTTGLSVQTIDQLMRFKNGEINKNGEFFDFFNALFDVSKGGFILFIVHLFRLMGTSEAVEIWNNTWETVYDEILTGSDEPTSEQNIEIQKQSIQTLEKIIAESDISNITKHQLELIVKMQTNIHTYEMFDYTLEELCDIERAKVIKEFNQILALVEG